MAFDPRYASQKKIWREAHKARPRKPMNEGYQSRMYKIKTGRIVDNMPVKDNKSTITHNTIDPAWGKLPEGRTIPIPVTEPEIPWWKKIDLAEKHWWSKVPDVRDFSKSANKLA